MTALIDSPPTFEVLLAKMRPYFRKYAKRFSPNKRLDRDDVMQDLTGIALQMYTSLVRRGKEVFYSPLAMYAIKRYSTGRRFTGLNSTDVHSEHAQMQGRSEVHQFSELEGKLDELEFMADPKANVAKTAQLRVDYGAWVSKQEPRDRQIIRDLSYGYTTREVARKYSVSDGLISQYRKRYREDWNDFVGDTM